MTTAEHGVDESTRNTRMSIAIRVFASFLLDAQPKPSAYVLLALKELDRAMRLLARRGVANDAEETVPISSGGWTFKHVQSDAEVEDLRRGSCRRVCDGWH